MNSLLALAMLCATIAAPAAKPVTFAHVTAHAPKAALSLEVADTEAKREYGLMNRLALGRHCGMVFVFDRDEIESFWMKNTLIPLDMVFLGADGRVRTVFGAVPASTPKLADSDVARRQGRAKFVIELNSGEAAADGLQAGALVKGLTGLKAAHA